MCKIIGVLIPLLFLSCTVRQSSSDTGEVCDRIITTSATQVGFLTALHQQHRIVATCNKERIYSPLPDSIPDLGDAMSPSLEKIVQLQPALVLLTSYTPYDPLGEQLKRRNIPILYINEWQERTPLLRAKWIYVLGELTHTKSLADSIYTLVQQRYDSICTLTKALTDTMTIMSGQDFRGTWYVPTGNTFMGNLFHDAGFTYLYATDTTTNSLPLSFEKALLTFQQMDIWVGVNANSLDELRAINPKHTFFKSFNNKSVYNFNKRSTPLGANDFWERGTVHPDEILHDLYVLRTKGDTSELYYTRQL